MVIPQESQPVASPVTIDKRWCKRCGICIAFCPKGVLAAGPDGYPEVVAPEKCIKCRLCEFRCPDFSIIVEEGDKNGG